ncbi:MAG: CoA ester lyase [Candidatus Methanomethylicia archaeon]
MILRSLLFVPANSWRMITRSLSERADAIVLDLEDSVPIGEKETARWFIKDFLEDIEDKPKSSSIFVRVNSISSGLYGEDVKYAVQKTLDGIVLPKTESGNDIFMLEEAIKAEENRKNLKNRISIIPIIESAKGLVNINEVVKASPRIVALTFGAADFLRDLGRSYMQLSKDEFELLYIRSVISITAHAYNILALDTVYLGLIIDMEGLERETRIASALGFKGKFVIHPSHVEIVNKIFTPSPQEVEEAEGIVKAYEDALVKGLGATTYAGRMIDEATYKQAKSLLQLVKEITERSKND